MSFPDSVRTKADVDELIKREEIERRTLDYKAELPARNDEAKEEFLGDVSSFANAVGGFLIYGVRAKRDDAGKTTGGPDEATGIANLNPDTERLWMEDVIRSGIHPRIPSFEIDPIEGFSEGPVLVIRIRRSWLAPHVVKVRKSTRFYSRTSTGKYPLDPGEVRDAFRQSLIADDRVRSFRDGRLARVLAGDTPINLSASPKLVMHLIPQWPLTVDLSPLEKRTAELAPLDPANAHPRFNSQGYAVTSAQGKGYVQVFRSGAIEIVDTYLLGYYQDRTVPGLAFCKRINEAIERFLKEQKALGVAPPIDLFVSLLGVKDFVIASHGPTRYIANEVDEGDLLLPDVLLPEFSAFTNETLRPAFDALYQAAGWKKCLIYDDEGRWNPDAFVRP